MVQRRTQAPNHPALRQPEQSRGRLSVVQRRNEAPYHPALRHPELQIYLNSSLSLPYISRFNVKILRPQVYRLYIFFIKIFLNVRLTALF